jgi:hypothetical protein
MKRVESLDTSHYQFVMRGTQVAYAGKTEANAAAAPTGLHDEIHIHIKPGRLKVARVVDIIAHSLGFAEGDGTFELVLDNGDKVNVEDVAVTDGLFKYA